MKNKVRQLGARFVQGFLILLPFLIAYLMLGQVFDMLMALTQPIIDVMPETLFSSTWIHRFAAAVLLAMIFIVVGLVGETAPARRVGNWIENTILNRFPPYTVLKSLSGWFAGNEVAQLQPALLSVTPDTRMLVAVVEELPTGDLSVFVPFAPTLGVGLLQIVSSGKVQKLECSMTEALGWLLNWGVGTETLLKPGPDRGRT